MHTSSHHPFVYGIDFGTSNSSVSVWDREQRSVMDHPLLRHQEPTLMYFPHARAFGANTRELFFGQEAIDHYIADNMDGRLLQAIKTILPDETFTETIINNETYTIEELVAHHLRNLKLRADRATGIDGKDVILGRPAVFHEDPKRDHLAENRLRSAARLAGFETIHFQYEPIAAARTYETSLTQPQTVLVGDFGGGTSDFTLMRLDPAKRFLNDREVDVLATGGVPSAGNRLDAEVMWYKLTPLFGRNATYSEFGREKILPVPTWPHHQICQWDRVPFLNKDIRLIEKLEHFVRRSDQPEGFTRLLSLIRRNLGFSLFQQIERSKIRLTTEDRTHLTFPDAVISISESFDFREFREMTASVTTAITSALDTTLARAGLDPDTIDCVFLTGGSSLVRNIRSIFTDRFGEDRIRTGDTFASVSRGLALSAPLFER
ncbi:MAG: Hsp70 family protein [Opitutaceae bacterium]